VATKNNLNATNPTRRKNCEVKTESGGKKTPETYTHLVRLETWLTNEDKLLRRLRGGI